MKKILLISTGGTISMDNGVNGLTPSDSKDSNTFVKAINCMCKIETLNLYSLDSSNLIPENWIRNGRMYL
jgi:L-asparaginase